MKLYRYAPDVDPTEPGILTDGDQFIPTPRGHAGAPGTVDAGLSALASACVSAVSMLRLDGAVRTFAGTNSNLYEVSGSSWTVVSRASPYTTVVTRWRYAQFGNVSLASSKENKIQASSSGAFADVTAAPKAAVIETVGQQILAFDIDDGSDKPDGWACSALGNHTDWTPSIATQAATGRLTDVPGRITAARRFGSGIFVGKERGCYFGSYAGPPFIWEFQTIPSDFGPVSQEACIQIGTPEQPRLMFLGVDNFYLYDGARPYPIGEEVRETFFSVASGTNLKQTSMLHDVKRGLVWVFYPSAGSALNKALVYHYKSNRWGVANMSIQAALAYATPSLTFDQVPSTGVTFDQIPAVPFDQLFVSPSALGVPAVIGTDRKAYLLNGKTGSSYVVTGLYGDDYLWTLARRMKVRWLTKPNSARLEGFVTTNPGESRVKKSEANVQPDGRFNFIQSGRWHQFQISTTGNWELNEIAPDTVTQGYE